MAEDDGPNQPAQQPKSQPRPAEEHHPASEDKPKWTDIAIAFFTVCLVAVAYWQGHIFDKQWNEMHSGGVDTHELALAAKAQADEAKAQVEKLTESLTKTEKLIGATKALADDTKTLADNTLRQANATQAIAEQSITEGRPWIGIGVTVAGFEATKEAKATFQVTNSGRRPAKINLLRFSSREYLEFPELPYYSEAYTKGSTLIIVPGAGSTSELLIDKTITEQRNFDSLNTATTIDGPKLFVFGKWTTKI
jgi:hypothetical protein